jgi:hypothetical protein
MTESRSSLVAQVRVVVFIFVSLRIFVCGLESRMLEWEEVGFLIACACLMPCAAIKDSGWSIAVDIFNVKSGNWSTAVLSIPRSGLAATSLPNIGIAIFAGGVGTCCHFYFLIFAYCGVRAGKSDG